MTACNFTSAVGTSLLATAVDGGDIEVKTREQLTINGTVAATGKPSGSDGTITFDFPTRKTPAITGSVMPTASLSPLATCTMPNQITPPCLDPCPMCGNGVTEYPETCDDGMATPLSCDGCSIFCQLEDQSCNDELMCTADSCNPTLGCVNAKIPPPCTEPPTPTHTLTPSVTGTPTLTPTITDTPTITSTPTITDTPTITPTPPNTPTVTETPTPPNTPTVTATETAAVPPCPGDCDGSGDVAINELVTGVNIALGNLPLDSCPSFDLNGDGEVAINELIAAVNSALNGCPQ